MKYIKLFDGGLLAITDEGAEELKKIIEAGVEIVQFGESWFRCSHIVGIFSEEHIIETQKSAKGLWQCIFGYWHTKNQGCKDNWSIDVNGCSLKELLPLPRKPVDTSKTEGLDRLADGINKDLAKIE